MSKKSKTYCNKCRFYIAKSEEIGDNHICGFTIKITKSFTGEMVAELNDDREICEECGHTIRDERGIKYIKCIQKNSKFDCPDFKKRNIGNVITYTRLKLTALNKWHSEVINKNNFYMMIIWFVFNAVFIYELLKKEVVYQFLLAYIIISVVYFKHAITKKD